jgi:hypothetical protein
VLFPRTWEKFREQLTIGRIVIVEGKVDTSNTPPKVLVDNIRTEIKVLEPLDSGASPVQAPVASKQAQAPVAKPTPTARPVALPAKQVAEQPAAYAARQGSSQAAGAFSLTNMPPPPDNFPDGWDAEWQPSFEAAQFAARPEAAQTPKAEDEATDLAPSLTFEDGAAHPTETAEKPVTEPEGPRPVESVSPALAIQPVETAAVETPSMPSLYIPVAQEEKNKDHPPQQITVMLRSSGDKERDKLRIKTIYGTLISFHGKDRFSFQIFESGKGHLIDFPSDTTRLCPEMLARLGKLIGEESWRIEEITFQ